MKRFGDVIAVGDMSSYVETKCGEVAVSVKITVPATSANLGRGYDCLGMAVSCIRNSRSSVLTSCRFRVAPRSIAMKTTSCTEALSLRLRTGVEEPFPIKLHIDAAIPVSRGLGSSSTCTVAGIMGAAALTGRIVGRAEAVSIATEMEGHPDNVAPAIMGSLVCSFTPQGELPNCIRYNVNRTCVSSR